MQVLACHTLQTNANFMNDQETDVLYHNTWEQMLQTNRSHLT